MTNAAIGFANSPNAALPIDLRAAVRDFMAGSGAGFREIWMWNPTLKGSSGEGMTYPVWSRADVLGACYEAALAGAEWVPYIGGGATGDIDLTAEGLDKFRPCIGVACDQVADDEEDSASDIQAGHFIDAGKIWHPEGNSKAKFWVQDLVRSCSHLVRPCAEWWLWDLPIPGATLAWSDKRWAIKELIDLGSQPTVIITRQNNNKGYGFAGVNYTNQQWAAKKMELARAYWAAGCKVVVRASGLNAAQLEELRGMQ